MLLVNTTTPADNSAAEFHKLRRGIWQNLPRRNGGPGHILQLVYKTEAVSAELFCVIIY